MADYTTNLKSWGSTGQEYPDGYFNVEGEAPVDAWENFLKHNVISDVNDHLIPLTNSRIESDTASTRPSNPENGHLFYNNNEQVFEQYRFADSSWHTIALKADLTDHTSDTTNPHSVTLEQVRSGGDSFSGDVDFGSNAITNLSYAKFSSGDIRVNHAARELLVDEHDGSSWTTRLSVDETGASVTGNLTTSGTLSVSGSSTFNSNVDLAGNALEKIGSATFSDWTVTEDGTSGNLEATHSGSTVLDVGSSTVNVVATLQESGDQVATRKWTENNADVPNADYADEAGNAETLDGKDATDLGSGASDGGTTVVSNATDFNFGSNLSVTDDGDKTVTVNASNIPDTHTSISEDGSERVASVGDIDFTGHLNVVDDGDGTVTLDPTHNHDSRYVNASDHNTAAHDALDIDADTIDGQHWSDIQTWVNNTADVSNADHSDSASESDTIVAGGNLKGNLNALNGETLWDENAGYIPQNRLENDTVTIAGNGVSLGNSVSVAHGDLSDAPASAHHTRYADSEAVTAINNETSLSVDISGDADTLDGQHYSDIQNWVNNNADVPNADTVDGIDASGLAKRSVGVEHDVYTSESDVPSSITKGEVVLIDGDGLYVEK
jgi:hypothetical protein